MKRKIKILFLIDYLYGFSGGGTETHLSYLAHLLDKKKFECLIVAFDTGDAPITRKIISYGIDIVHVPVGKIYAINAFFQAIVLARLVKTYQADIVQTFHFKSDTYGAFVVKLAGCKNIISSRRDIGDKKERWHFWLNRVANRYIKGFIVVANMVGTIVKQKEYIPASKLKTIYNGVDTVKFVPPSAAQRVETRSALRIKESDFVLGMVAVFRQEKNHDVLIKGFEDALKSVSNIKLLLVGGGELFEYYKEYCQHHGLSGKVIFTGATSNVQKFLPAFDAACLVPGSNEGFSNSILEKMATGLPLIVTDVGGNAEAVVNGYNGFVIPPDNSQKLTESLIYLADHPSERKEMGRRSVERVRKMFTLTDMIKAHEKLYESILAS